LATGSASLPGLHSPEVGFEQPFEMLHACHDRVRRSLQLLERLVAHAQANGADAQARSAAADVLRYFDIAAPAHHEDEERHLVPRLQASGDARAQQAAATMLADHVLIRERWQALRPLLQSLRNGTPPPPPELADAANAFRQVHDTHLPLEDTLAFPHAEALARAEGAAALEAMGTEMANRRRQPSPSST
jgi:hemerythrin-like domain-containing protein